MKTDDKRAKDSIAVLNEILVDKKGCSFTDVLVRIQRHFASGKQKKRKVELSQSQASGTEAEEEEEDDEPEVFVIDEEDLTDFSKETVRNPHMAMVVKELKAAQELVGDNVAARACIRIILLYR